MADTTILMVKNTFLHVTNHPSLTPQRSQSVPPRYARTWDASEPGTLENFGQPVPHDKLHVDINRHGDCSTTIGSSENFEIWSDDASCQSNQSDEAHGNSVKTLSPYEASSEGDRSQLAPAMQKVSDVGSMTDGPTALMMYKLPFALTDKQASDMVDEFGFAGAWDFLYVPRSKGRGQRKFCDRAEGYESMGYGFINFKTPELAAEFLRKFQNVPLPHYNSKRLAGSKLSLIQSYEALLEKRACK